VKCVVCGRSEDRHHLYILSGHALRQFFPLVGELLTILPYPFEVFNNHPFHVCTECLKLTSN